MQTELAERFHLCASDKQAKVCVRQECQTDLSSVGVSSPASRHKTSSVTQTGNRPPLAECTKACRQPCLRQVGHAN